MADLAQKEWTTPDFAALGFVRVTIAGGSDHSYMGFSERSIQLRALGDGSLDSKNTLATLRYPWPIDGPHTTRHFVTTESFPVTYIVDGDDMWLWNGRTPSLETDLVEQGGFVHYCT